MEPRLSGIWLNGLIYISIFFIYADSEFDSLGKNVQWVKIDTLFKNVFIILFDETNFTKDTHKR